jgi:epoxyqueuosine reductase
VSDIHLIHQCAKALGFDLVGISGIKSPDHDRDAFLQWLQENKHGSMAYLARDPARRTQPELLVPEAKSIIWVALNYHTPQTDTAKPKIGRYALAKPDYHLVFEQKLAQLCADLTQHFTTHDQRFYVDYGPLMERSFAAQSQMGFIGKNTMLITPEYGSWILLGEIITTLALPETEKRAQGQCGTCQKCITVCPTKALSKAYDIDSRLCISYLTIENKGAIPVELRPLIGTWLFGCDLCQEVCPHNSRANAYTRQAWQDIVIEADLQNPDYLNSVSFLHKIVTIHDQATFKQFFRNTPFLRAKRIGLIRNACVVIGNLRDQSFTAELEQLLHDPSEIIQEHAQWALDQLQHSNTP